MCRKKELNSLTVKNAWRIKSKVDHLLSGKKSCLKMHWHFWQRRAQSFMKKTPSIGVFSDTREPHLVLQWNSSAFRIFLGRLVTSLLGDFHWWGERTALFPDCIFGKAWVVFYIHVWLVCCGGYSGPGLRVQQPGHEHMKIGLNRFCAPPGKNSCDLFLFFFFFLFLKRKNSFLWQNGKTCSWQKKIRLLFGFELMNVHNWPPSPSPTSSLTRDVWAKHRTPRNEC